VENELEITALIAVAQGILPAAVFRLVAPAIPKHDRAAAILALGNRALEAVVLDGMVFDFHGEPAHRRVVTRPFWHRPALHHAVEL